MKKIIYSILSILLGSLSLVSCQDDNYDEPNSGIKGRFIDAETTLKVLFVLDLNQGPSD